MSRANAFESSKYRIPLRTVVQYLGATRFDDVSQTFLIDGPIVQYNLGRTIEMMHATPISISVALERLEKYYNVTIIYVHEAKAFYAVNTFNDILDVLKDETDLVAHGVRGFDITGPVIVYDNDLIITLRATLTRQEFRHLDKNYVYHVKLSDDEIFGSINPS